MQGRGLAKRMRHRRTRTASGPALRRPRASPDSSERRPRKGELHAGKNSSAAARASAKAGEVSPGLSDIRSLKLGTPKTKKLKPLVASAHEMRRQVLSISRQSGYVASLTSTSSTVSTWKRLNTVVKHYVDSQLESGPYKLLLRCLSIRTKAASTIGA